MRLACPACDAVYEVPDDAIPAEGREVECGACNRRWHQDGGAAGDGGGADPAVESAGGAAAIGPARPGDDDADAPPDWADPQDEADRPRPPPVRDPEDLRILREEAERESRLRRGEPAGDGDDAAPMGDPAAPGQAAAAAGDDGGPDAAAVSGHGVDRIVPKRLTRSGARSTARPRPDGDVPARGGRTADPAAAVRPRPSGAGVPPEPAAEPARRGGFKRGFLGVVALAAILAGLYAYADRIAQAVPAAAPAAEVYADTVDAARAAAEDAVRRSRAALGGTR